MVITLIVDNCSINKILFKSLSPVYPFQEALIEYLYILNFGGAKLVDFVSTNTNQYN